MRVRNSNLRLAVDALCLGMFLLTSACSSNSGSISETETKSQTNKAVSISKKTKPKDKDLKHSHESNPCTEAVEHAHVFDDKDHQHSYDCENTNEIISNAHIHKATPKNRRFRHVHPNGSNQHSHHR